MRMVSVPRPCAVGSRIRCVPVHRLLFLAVLHGTAHNTVLQDSEATHTRLVERPGGRVVHAAPAPLDLGGGTIRRNSGTCASVTGDNTTIFPRSSMLISPLASPSEWAAGLPRAGSPCMGSPQLADEAATSLRGHSKLRRSSHLASQMVITSVDAVRRPPVAALREQLRAEDSTPSPLVKASLVDTG